MHVTPTFREGQRVRYTPPISDLAENTAEGFVMEVAAVFVWVRFDNGMIAGCEPENLILISESSRYKP